MHADGGSTKSGSIADSVVNTALLSRKAVRGSVWSAAAVIVSNVSFMITLWFLARLLTPEDYGMVGILISYTVMINNVSELGLGAALIQKQQLTHLHSSTVFWTNLAMGVALCFIGILVAPLVGDFFRTPAIVIAFASISATFILYSLGVVQRSLLSKSLAFRQVAIAEIASSVALMVITGIFALMGAGLYSIVGGVLLRTTLYSVLMWTASPWRPSFQWKYATFKEMIGFASGVVAASLVNDYNRTVDSLIIGRVKGTVSLGYYTLAYQLVTYPRAAIQPLIARVAFPALSAMQEDDAAIRTVYCRMVSLLALVMFPFMTLLSAVAPSLVAVVYGEKWLAAVLPLQILCIGGALLSVPPTWSAVFLAKGRSDIGVKQGVITAVLLTLFIGVGVFFGVVGVAVALTTYACLFVPVFQVWINELIKLRYRDLLKSLVPAALGSIVTMVVAHLIQGAAIQLWRLPTVVVLTLGLASGASAYLGYLFVFHRQELLKLVRVFREAFLPSSEFAAAGRGES